MSLILRKASFKDSEGLLKIVDLFNRGSITNMALASELTSACQEIMSFGNNVYVEIIEGKTGGKSFGMAMMPKPTPSKMDLEIYIDKAVFGILSSAQVLEALLLLISNYPKITMEYTSFSTKMLDFDVDLVDTLAEAMRLYKISLEIIRELPDSEKELSMINSPDAVQDTIDKLEKENWTDETAKELVVTGNLLPEKFVEVAADIVKNARKNAAGLELERKENTVFGTKYEEIPTIDLYYNNIRNATDRTYPMYQPKEIDPHYEPETNQ